jgi:molybdopterin/thiamine biosynthesis adenylyltransferase/rhodanese-related sulfurtransferase
MTHTVPESVYYARHFRLPGFSEQTQKKLQNARVLVVGVGGLGCPAALYLAGAGVGTIALCDADEVSATNLHRQMLFDSTSIGEKKVEVAARRLRTVNPYIVIETIPRFANPKLLLELVPCYDLVLDGTDNFSAKYAINDACEAAGVPLVYGSIFQFEGQVSIFHLPTHRHPQGFSYRDVFPDAPPAGLAQNCGEAGVIGVLPGIIGTMQANEAIKVITGLGEPLSGYLVTFDALGAVTRKLTLTKRDHSSETMIIDDISYDELLARLASATPPMLVDVRDLAERQLISLGGEHVPLAMLPKYLSLFSNSGIIVVYCKSGLRSSKAALYLRSVLPNTTILNLRGGVDACMGNSIGCAA